MQWLEQSVLVQSRSGESCDTLWKRFRRIQRNLGKNAWNMSSYDAGTPYIYEGEELGMTNADFTKIEEYKDVEALDIFKDFTERKGFSKEDTSIYFI